MNQTTSKMNTVRKLKSPLSAPSNSTMSKAPMSTESAVSACVSELMNAATSFHKLHLKVIGNGSYAAHKALNELYDALPGHADSLAEGWQGASCCILSYSESTPQVLNSVEDALAYIKVLKGTISSLQSSIPYSEIVNDLDVIKSALNSANYKLTFLK